MTGTYPEILTHPNIPKPLHGIAPRAIKGNAWWDVERKKCYAAAGQKCEACGVTRISAWPNRWLEAHEEYEYTSNGSVLIFKRLVCLCPACHMFIHSGRLQVLLRAHTISQEKFRKIVNHGILVLTTNNLLEKWESRHLNMENTPQDWQAHRMIFEGKEYGPSTQSYKSWVKGDWKNWKP